MEPQLPQKPASILQRTVTTLPKVASVTRLESLANDAAMRMPVRLEDRMGRTLEDMLRTP